VSFWRGFPSSASNSFHFAVWYASFMSSCCNDIDFNVQDLAILGLGCDFGGSEPETSMFGMERSAKLL
jgi:hypothetical protein